MLYIQRGNYEASVRVIRQSLNITPVQPDALNALGNALRILLHYDQALAAFDTAIALDDTNALAYYNRGVTLTAMYRHEEALASYDMAIAVRPNYVEALVNRGNVLHELMRYDKALDSYDRAIAFAPGFAEAHYNRATLLRAMKRYDEALASFQRAYSNKPSIPYLLGHLLNCKMHLAQWQGVDADLSIITSEVDAGRQVITPFCLLSLPSTEAQQRKCATLYVASTCPRSADSMWSGQRYSHDKIRVGYFSADFFNHATAYLMAGMLESHDHARFHISAFAFGSTPADSMRSRIMQSCDQFCEVSAYSDHDIASLVRDMEIDIAVDLKGFTTNARPAIFAHRPAPVQIQYLGYPGTMGAEYIDYLVADHIVLPDEHRKYYSERIAYLPNSYQVNDDTRRVADKPMNRREAGLPEEGFVFCCFNNVYKVTPDVFAVWMRLLHMR